MATPIDLVDPPAVMSYGGLVDASTAEGQVDEAADWAGAIAAMLIVYVGDVGAAELSATDEKPDQRLAHITSRRGTYSPPAR